jgi:UPF0271 protein
MELNADLAEGEALSPVDRALLDVVTSASLACGFQAGNRMVMRAAAELCVERGVAIGGRVTYVKPHVALYHSIATDTAVAATFIDALAPRYTVLVGPLGGTLAGPAAAAGVEVVPERFCDRGWDSRGLLLPWGETGDLIEDLAEVGERPRSLATEGRVRPIDGHTVADGAVLPVADGQVVRVATASRVTGWFPTVAGI